jgi:hypothetical protein
VKLVINTADDDTYEIENFEAGTVLDLKQELNDEMVKFVTFEMDERTVLINKKQIVSIEVW